MLIFDVIDQAMSSSLEIFRQELRARGAFVSVARAGNVPDQTCGRTRVRPEGVSDEDSWIWSALALSPEAVPTQGMQIAQGRDLFSQITLARPTKHAKHTKSFFASSVCFMGASLNVAIWNESHRV